MQTPSINSTPDSVEPPPFDADAWLASHPAADDGLPTASDPIFFDTRSWAVVPATVRDENGFTEADYEAAADEFNQSDELDAKELGIQALRKAFAMRRWLALSQGGGKN